MTGAVLIVDAHTGCIQRGRHHNEGMHQAIEAKEGVAIKAENQTLATITLQNYFRLYDKLSGMTGTAQTEAAEFQGTYNLGVVPIPTNMPMIRIDQSDLVYKNEDAKYKAVVEDIVERHAAGQPVLVGTISVEKSERLSQMLRRLGVPHEVLNAKQHAREAPIVAQAGRKGAVTVATNMAGRGTDIMLGGNAEFMAVQELAGRGLDPAENPEEYEAAWPDALAKNQAASAAEHDEVVELGGLYVLGTERHESRRIDNQLRGRSGRQGDPGETRFYLSAEDELIRLFAGDRMYRILSRLGPKEGEPLEAKMLSSVVEKAQVKVEELNFLRRKNVLKYDEVMNEQRRVVYDQRQRILMGEDFGEQVREMVSELVEGAVRLHLEGEQFSEEWDLDSLFVGLRQIYDPAFKKGDIDLSSATLEEVIDLAVDDALAEYDERERVIGEEQMRSVERAVMLQVIDTRWKDHLLDMDYLQEGIHLRALGQRDPLVEFKGEGFDLFQDMMEGVKSSTVTTLMKNSPEDLAVFTAVTLEEPLMSLNYTSGDDLITQTSFTGAALAAGEYGAPVNEVCVMRSSPL